jgi:hypothetical protein
MKVSKMIVVNIGNYQSIRIGVDDCPSYAVADGVLIRELERIQIPIDSKIKQAILWDENHARQ